MGTVTSNLSEKLTFKDKDSKILMLGLDSAGKTTILNRLSGSKEHSSTQPTIGFNVQTVSPMKNVLFTVWDVGGQDKMRPLWKHHFLECRGLIFVTDSSDLDRIDLAKSELCKILSEEEMSGVPVLLLANKQDLDYALTPKQITSRFGLENLTGRQFAVHGVSGLNGTGIKESMQVLVKMVKCFVHGS